MYPAYKKRERGVRQTREGVMDLLRSDPDALAEAKALMLSVNRDGLDDLAQRLRCGRLALFAAVDALLIREDGWTTASLHQLFREHDERHERALR